MMEEDINILEEVIEKYKTNTANILDLDSNDLFKRLILNQEQVQLLENLIKGYREKEESEKYLYDAYQDAGKKMFDYAEKCEKLERKIKIKDAYCNMIYMLGVDYDGFNTVESLKSLIDELVNCAERAYRSDDKYVVGESLGGKCYNILYEEVEKPEKFESMFKHEEE